MEPEPVLSHVGFCNDNQQNSWPDTKKVGVCLEEPTFTHGQLYFVASWVADPQHLHFAVHNGFCRKNRNVVYNEML